jgi:hypothetical protein
MLFGIYGAVPTGFQRYYRCLGTRDLGLKRCDIHLEIICHGPTLAVVDIVSFVFC